MCPLVKFDSSWRMTRQFALPESRDRPRTACTTAMSICSTEEPTSTQKQPIDDRLPSEPEWTLLRQTLTQDCANKLALRNFSCETREQMNLILRGYPLPSVLRRDDKEWQQIVEDESQVFSNLILASQRDDLGSLFPNDEHRAAEHIETEIHAAMPTLVAIFHTKLINTSLEMSIQKRAGGSLLDYLRLPSSIIETELYDWVSLHVRARTLIPDEDELIRAFTSLSECSCHALIPFIVIGAIRPSSGDTAAKGLERLQDSFDHIFDDRVRMLQDKKMPRAWIENARGSLRTIDSAYAMYLESFISRIAFAARRASVNKTPTKASSAKKPKPATASGFPGTPTTKRTPVSRSVLDKDSSAKANPSHTHPTPSPTLPTRTTAAPEPSTPSHRRVGLEIPKQALANSDIARAQAKAQERVRSRYQTSEITPGIVGSRRLTYGSPVKKAGAAIVKPAWR